MTFKQQICGQEKKTVSIKMGQGPLVIRVCVPVDMTDRGRSPSWRKLKQLLSLITQEESKYEKKSETILF